MARRGWVWAFNYLKATEGGMGTATAKRVLKGKKEFKFKTEPSSYVGHTLLMVESPTKGGLEKALRILKDYGYIESVSEEVARSRRQRLHLLI